MPLAADVASFAPPPHVIASPAAAVATWKTIVVRPGDTLWHLAIANRTTTAALVAKNRLADNGSLLHAGQKLLVPGTATTTPAKPAATATPRPAAPKPTTPAPTTTRIHVVKAGDTMSGIAKTYSVSLTKLLAANKLKATSVIYIGQRISVPGAGATVPTPTTPKPTTPKPTTPKPSTPAPTTTGTHVVKAGDTMSGIAKTYSVSLTKLLAANKLTATSVIYIGQRITVPGTGSAVPTSTTPKPSTTVPPVYTYPTKTAEAVAASKAKLAAMDVPNRTDTAAMIRATALRNGVDPKLAQAIGWQESGWNQRAVSYTNAVGVMQIMPIAATWANQLAGRELDRYDAQDNITSGVLILRSLQTSAESREQAIAAYYQGLYSVRTKGMYADTKKYVASILAIYDRL